jgi:hypothetical protein
MFKLNQAIAEWRRQMLAAGIKTPAPLEELEIHLREDIDTLRSSGMSEARAFHAAVSRLGTPGLVREEFKKVEHPRSAAATIASFAWMGTVVLLVLMLSGKLFSGKLSFLLFTHIVSLTAGYFAALLTGGLGIYHVCCRWFPGTTPSRDQSLGRAVVWFTRISAALVAVGVLLGMIWSKQNRGAFFGADPREIGTACVLAWLTFAMLIHRFRRANNHITMVMAVGGNIIVTLAWFGAGLPVHGRAMGSYWPLDALLGVQLLFFVLGLVPASEAAEA